MIDMLTLLQHFAHQRALVIGDAILDSYAEGAAARLCREGPVPIVHKIAEYHLPGGAANTAANLAALGARVHFLSLIGRDSSGTLLRQALHERGAMTHWMLESATGNTLHKQRILADGQYIVRIDEGGIAQGAEIDENLQQHLLDGLEEVYPQCDLVVVSDYGYGVVSRALIERLRMLHRQQPKVVLIDSKNLAAWHDFPATIVVPNYTEACALVEPGQTQQDAQADGLEHVERLARLVLAHLQAEHVAITLGQHGVFLLDRQGQTAYLPAYPVAHANDVGAGDSFAATLALSLSCECPVAEACALSIEAACVAVTKRWTALVSAQELRQRLEQRGEIAEAPESAKQVPLAELVNLLEPLRQSGQKIVFTNGIFDILHIGHIHLLRQARMQGDILIVGLNSDASTRRLKGKGRPINPERERMALVAALDAVDYVLLFEEETPIELIRTLRPHIHVKGGDYTLHQLPEAEAVREGGGRIVLLPLENGKSTSNTIERIASLPAHARAPGQIQGGME
jgi:D-beta-D-heptose 7-phosphate kinase / D-beta-D-heptose 1-phosphate adenosyltransferase